jgi:hypothetical protein
MLPIQLDRRSFDAEQLVESYPPRIGDPNKQIVLDIACPPDERCSGTIEYSRWLATRLPTELSLHDISPRVRIIEGVYKYPYSVSNRTDWHVNFADQHLFCGYATDLMAQDEIQVAEHPGLGSLREALVSANSPALTIDNYDPTPILVKGVERRCSIDTDPNASKQRPLGLYGNRFAHASEIAVRKATTQVRPPSITNIIAIAAPAHGYGCYEEDEIEHILLTAYSGFAAAVAESDAPVCLHTGFWGCGAFGGNRKLMTMLQLIAAKAAGVEMVEFYAFDSVGRGTAESALAQLVRLAADTGPNCGDIVRSIAAMEYEWGVSDGN